MPHAEVVVIGGGIVGLATADQLLQERPQTRVVVLEKERDIACHQTGHNSGVMHSGIYYTPGSLRAVNCRTGKQLLEQFCREQSIPFERCGKLILATSEAELPRLVNLHERGLANGVDCRLMEPTEFREVEPHAAGIRALHVPETGIVDFRLVAQRLAERVRSMGGSVVTSARVEHIHQRADETIVVSRAGEFACSQVVNCAGLQSDRVARRAGQTLDAQIVPFRGDYFELRPSATGLCRGLIYPVPNPAFPFLGVHFTRMIHGGVECGPNAVLALGREGYHKTSFHLLDTLESLTYSGFLRLAFRHWREGAEELYRSLSRRAFLRSLQRLVPAVQFDDLVPAPSGVRAQAVDRRGRLVDDFLIVETERAIHVCNAPSPAATASLSIGRTIAQRVLPRLNGAVSLGRAG